MEKSAANNRRQQKLHILFSFGDHDKGDIFIRNVIPLFNAFKPHVYSPESAGLLISERQAYERRLNNQCNKASKDPSFRRMLLRVEPEQDTENFSSLAYAGAWEFTVAEMGFLIDLKPMPIIYTLDASEDDSPASLMKSSLEKAHTAVRQFKCGNIETALQLTLDSHRDIVRGSLIREQSIVKNLPGLLNEAVEVFPKLMHLDEVRLLARFGSFHRDLFSMVQGLSEADHNIIVDQIVDEKHPAADLPFSDMLLHHLRRGLEVKEGLLFNVLGEMVGL